MQERYFRVDEKGAGALLAAAPDRLAVFEHIRWVPAEAKDTDVVVYEERPVFGEKYCDA